MTDSMARQWMNVLERMRGRHIEWPQLLRSILAEDFKQTREHGTPYKGAVFQNRDGRAKTHANHPRQDRENLKVYNFYDAIHTKGSGVLTVGDEKVWIVSAQVPNQGGNSEKGRRADLVGLREDGSLVVFECKISSNRSDSPLKALLECLDYTAHLMLRDNIEKFNKGLNAWRGKREVPQEFARVCLKANTTPLVVVMAQQQYFNTHWLDANGREQQWQFLADRFWKNRNDPFQLEFAVTDYSSHSCSLLSLNRPNK